MGGGPHFFSNLLFFSWSVLLGLCSGISETHVHCQFLGAWCRYHLGDQFLFFVCFFMTWSALLFGKSSVQCIDHGYVLGVNFIPYCMYSSHFWSRVFTFFVIFECMRLHWLAKYDCTTLFMILHCKFVYFRTALTYSAFAFFFIPEKKCIMAYCIQYRNALHFSSNAYCICFLPVLTSLYGRLKGRAEGGAHFFCVALNWR